MKEQKRIPKIVKAWLFLVGAMFGVLFAGFMFIFLGMYRGVIGWFCLLLCTVGLMYVTSWKYGYLLEEWGIGSEKPEEKKEE